ncbi:MAG: carbohydrate ABC transporter permease [Thermoprotei archaeon]|nr:MAG: carbohydrate ABC transporter permease [Thermoprotei archaeon]
MGMNRRKLTTYIFQYILIIVVLSFFMLPIYWTLITSFKESWEIVKMPPSFIPEKPTFNNYLNILSNVEFTSKIRNSVIACFGSLAIALITGLPAAYVISRLRFKGSNSLYYTYITFRMLPPFVFLIPLYVFYRSSGLYDTYIGLILAYCVITIPLTVWMMVGYYDALPRELEEAALVDGCDRRKVFLHIVLPLSVPGIISTSLLNLIFTWNDFVFALILTSYNAATIPIGLLGFIGYTEIKWGMLAAATIIASIPLLLIVLFVQKYLVAGLTLGAIKG